MSANDQTVEFMKSVFKTIAKKWTFQLERGEESTEKNPDGYLHHQCRISLFKKTTENAVKTLLFQHDVTGFRVSHTSNEACKGEPFYCMKEQTRVEGPWSDRDKERKLTRTAKKLQDQGLLPWQNSLFLEVDDYDDRCIHIVIDVRGNRGKGAFCKYAYCKGWGSIVPPFEKMEDVVQFCMSQPNEKLYIIDMPRSMPKKALASFYAGVETLKDGYLYDKRYHGKFMLIDEPNIIVFTNRAPKKMYLSLDRWKMWTITDEDELVPYVYPVRPTP